MEAIMPAAPLTSQVRLACPVSLAAMNQAIAVAAAETLLGLATRVSVRDREKAFFPVSATNQVPTTALFAERQFLH